MSVTKKTYQVQKCITTALGTFFCVTDVMTYEVPEFIGLQIIVILYPNDINSDSVSVFCLTF